MRGSTLIKIAGVLVGAGAMYYFTTSNPAASTGSSTAAASASAALAPELVPSAQKESLTMFIKVKACEATNCDEVACEKFSDGQSADGVAHLARCRWTDRSRGASPRRCAYVHYVEQAGKKSLGALFLSTPSGSDICEPDQAFNDLLKNDVGYSGQLP